MTFDWHMLYPLHTVIFDNSQVFGGVPCKAQLCNFSKWFFSPCFGVVPIWELWQFCYVRIEPPKLLEYAASSCLPDDLDVGDACEMRGSPCCPFVCMHQVSGRKSVAGLVNLMLFWPPISQIFLAIAAMR